MWLAVLVSIQLRAGGPRHASGTRQLPSKPCRPLKLIIPSAEARLPLGGMLQRSISGGRPENPMTEPRTVFWCLVGVIVSLLLVGLVSGTPLRHMIQVAPACLVAIAAWRGSTWSRAAAALPIYLIWLFLMVLIWLFLLRIAAVINGTFSTTETILTIVIGLAAVGGIVSVSRGKQSATWTRRVLAFLVAAALQVGAVWLSFQRAFVRR